MFDNVSDEDLQAELNRRKEAAREKAVPKQLASFDFDPLKKTCQDYINYLAKDGYADDDYEHYIYVAAMNCIFGHDVWEWINKRC